MVLREDAETRQIQVEGLHKVFRTNETLSPKEISHLLGIDVNASSFVEPSTINGSASRMQFFTVWFLSIAFASIGMLLFMQMKQIGLFYPGVA